MINNRGQLYCIDFIKNFDSQAKSIDDKAQLKIKQTHQKDFTAADMPAQTLESCEAKEGWEISRDLDGPDNNENTWTILNRSVTLQRERPISTQLNQVDPDAVV